LSAVGSLSAQQLVYDLKQDWIYYNAENQGFLPLDKHNIENRAISFALEDPEFDQFCLTLVVAEKAYLFYRTKLLATVLAGTTNYKIDSLKNMLGNDKPYLTIYGNNLLPQLITEVRTLPTNKNGRAVYQPIRFINNFSNFFYLSLTIILFLLVILKTRFSDLADQYLLFQRSLRIKTIDELIYKIHYLRFPNILFIAAISIMFGFVALSFMYFYPGQLSILNINPVASTFSMLVISWLEISGILFLALVLKYLLTLFISSMFSLNVASIHYASSLRLLFPLAIVLIILTLFQFLSVGLVTQPVYWIIFLFGLLIMEVILLLKLSLVTTHALIYIIVYLCATELIPIVFFIKYYIN